MLTLLEINKATKNKIKAALVGTAFSTVPIIAEDVSEPIIRPSLKVNIESSTNGKFNANCREKTLTIRVFYFAKDRYKYSIDNAKMQELLENAFLEDLQVTEGFFIPIESVSSEVSDTVLICSFDLYSVELLPSNDTDLENMEEIKQNQSYLNDFLEKSPNLKETEVLESFCRQLVYGRDKKFVCLAQDSEKGCLQCWSKTF